MTIHHTHIYIDIGWCPIHGLRDRQVFATGPGPPIGRSPTKIAIDSHGHVVDLGGIGIDKFSIVGCVLADKT